MNIIMKKRIASAVAAGAMFLNIATPAFATTLEISGNGSGSSSQTNVGVTQTTQVHQTNVADVYNNVNADASTGGNDANDNTGGDVSVDTGDAKVLVDVANNLNSNTAEVDCCEALNDIDVLIEGNGSDSENDVNLGVTRGTTLVQTNVADVTNLIDADAKTGYNGADDNTGGNVSIDTGSATTGVSLSTSANSNAARIGGNGGGEGSLSARILGNGTESDNDINLGLTNTMGLFQTNVADIYNDVDAEAKTGENDADDNTGGDVMIDTGNALVGVEIDNMVNFNWADVDCGCLFDIMAKIAENGSDSENDINAGLTDSLLVSQTNGCEQYPSEAFMFEGPRGEECELENNVDADAKTGKNDAEDNTGESDGDPSVNTGNASTGVELENSGNVNVFGEGFELPELEFDFDFGMNWALMWAFFSGHSS